MSDEVFKVRLGLKWCGWTVPHLAARMRVSGFELKSALSGNNRARDKVLLREAVRVICTELERQCTEVERKYGVKRGDVLANLRF